MYQNKMMTISAKNKIKGEIMSATDKEKELKLKVSLKYLNLYTI